MATKMELLDELRFAKRQQWAATAIALIAGIHHIADNADPPMSPWEQHLAAFVVLCVAGGGIGMLSNFKAISNVHDWKLIRRTIVRGGEVWMLSLHWRSL